MGKRDFDGEVRKRLAALGLDAAREAEIVEELAQFLDQRFAELRRTGASAGTARRVAFRELEELPLLAVELPELKGAAPVETRQHTRRGTMFAGLWQDVRYAVRTLHKQPAFALAVILTLALGIGANTAMFSVVHGVLLRPLPFPEPHRLAMIWQTNAREKTNHTPFSPPNFVDTRNAATSFQSLGAFASTSRILTGGEPERVAATEVTGGFFEAAGVPPQLGRGVLREDETPGGARVVVLGHGVWQRRFGGDATIVGKAISVSDELHTVIGVMPAGFRFPEETDLWTALRFAPEEMQQRNSFYTDVVARLKPGVTPEQAQAELDSISNRLAQQYPESNKDWGTRLILLHQEITGDVRGTLLLLFGAVGFVLLIACGNVASLFLARSAGRTREMAVRAAMGAAPSRIARQLLTENVLLSLAGGAVGLMLGAWVLGVIQAMDARALPRFEEVRFDGNVFAFALLLSVVTGVVFGLAPAFQAARVDLNEALKEGMRGSSGMRHRRMHGALVVTELALSLMLLVGAGLMLRTIWTLVNTNPGFDAAGILTADVLVPPARYREDAQVIQFAQNVLEQVRSLPGVETAAFTNSLPLGWSNWAYAFLIEGQPEPNAQSWKEMPSANFRSVTPEYFRALRIPLIRGRLVSESDGQGTTDVIVINEALARKYWPNEDPIGRRVRLAQRGGPRWREIVGIVGNIHHRGLHIPPEPEFYVPFAQRPVQSMRLAVRVQGDPMALAAALPTAVWAVDKDQPVTRIRPLTQIVSNSMAESRFYGTLLGAFAGVAVLLAAVGVYGVMAYGVAQRTREIGVRMTLGAEPGGILRMIVRQGMLLALIGVVLGTGGALGLTRYLQTLVHNVTTTDPPTFAAAAVLLSGIALVACYLPARRAARVDPIVALREE